jgi:hypothetical protein
MNEYRLINDIADGAGCTSSENAQRLMDQRDRAVMLAGELVAIIRVNAMRGTWSEANAEQVDEFLVPWIAKLRVAQGHSPANAEVRQPHPNHDKLYDTDRH